MWARHETSRLPLQTDRKPTGCPQAAIPASASKQVAGSNGIRSFERGRRGLILSRRKPPSARWVRDAMIRSLVHSSNPNKRALHSRQRCLPCGRRPTRHRPATASRRSPRGRPRGAEVDDESQSCENREQDIMQFATTFIIWQRSSQAISIGGDRCRSGVNPGRRHRIDALGPTKTSRPKHFAQDARR